MFAFSVSRIRSACAVLLALICAHGPAWAQTAGGGATIVGAGEESYPSLHFRGFSDIAYTESDVAGKIEGFRLGQFVLHLTSPLARKVGFFGELSVTPRSDQFSIEVERSFIRYDYNDLFKVSAGRYHTPIGYWNTAFHHGLWLQTTVRRPEQIQFGGTYVPVHFVGIVAEGKLPSGPLGLGYSAGVGNGRGDQHNRGGDAGDANTNRAWNAQLLARPIQAYGLEAAGSVYHDLLHLTGRPSVEEWIYSGHLVWTRESPELLGEFVGVRHDEDGSGYRYDSRSYYVQAAYRLPGRASLVKPYSRYERMEIAAGDPIFPLLKDLQVVTGGIRVDFTDLAALKAEYRNELVEGAERANTLLLQVSFTF